MQDTFMHQIPPLFLTNKFDFENCFHEGVFVSNGEPLPRTDYIKIVVSDPEAYIDSNGKKIPLSVGTHMISFAMAVYSTQRLFHKDGTFVKKYMVAVRPAISKYVQKISEKLYTVCNGVCLDYEPEHLPTLMEKNDGWYKKKMVSDGTYICVIKSHVVDIIQKDSEMNDLCISWDKDFVRQSFPPCIYARTNDCVKFSTWLKEKYNVDVSFEESQVEVPRSQEEIDQEIFESRKSRANEVQKQIDSEMFEIFNENKHLAVC